MKTLGVLGTSSSAGKTWMSTALCAWLRRQGVRVAPFKAQNMSNNALYTTDGGEIARAQAMQAEACGLLPRAEMNPILLKPSGALGSQLVLKGRIQGYCTPAEYYRRFDELWALVADCLDGWRGRCDVLVMEGAGSPVELNLMERDLVNLRPLRHTKGRWLLVGDIDRGGVFAQLAGTWALMPQEDRARALGAIINRFRGDPGLFPDPQRWLAPHAPGLDVLGTVPYSEQLRPDEEDGIDPCDCDRGEGDELAWIKLPNTAILNDCQPWWDDQGVRVRWVDKAGDLGAARAIVIPGTTNTVADMHWLWSSGMADSLRAAAARGVPIVGICGGFQILGEQLCDQAGVAGDPGTVEGLGLLPHRTEYLRPKIVRHVTSRCGARDWTTYEIHMGRSIPSGPCETLNTLILEGQPCPEGIRKGKVWGTYQHGWFDAPETRRLLAQAAGMSAHKAGELTWPERRQAIYSGMADILQQHVNLDPVRRELGL